MGIPDHLTCLLRNLYESREAIFRTGHGTTDWFQIGKGVHQGCVLSPCLFNWMESTSCEMPGWMKHKFESRLLKEIYNLRYADDNTLMAESKEEEPLDESERGERKAGLKLNIQKQRSWHPVPSLHGKEMGKQWKQ